MELTLNQEEYESLIALAQRGASTADEKRQLDAWLTHIETKNGIVRHRLWVQWQEADSPLPPTTRFPEKWPPELRAYIEQITRPISKEDVQQVLKQKARNPVTVLVTPDPGATLGWTPIDSYFV